ncbi:MAG: LacI family DNA-binding transcriptional regulator [Fimbriimonas sp.]
MSKLLMRLSKIGLAMAATPEKQAGRATLIEVAARAGVSATTASLVLSGKAQDRRISEEAHARVRLAAKELNYAPNLLTRSLRRGRTHIVSFYNAFRNRESHDLYMDKLATAVEYAGGALGYDILAHCRYERSPEETYQFLNGGLADGVLLFAPRQDDPMVALFRRSNLPVVLLNSRDSEGVIPSIADDGAQGMALIAQALADQGHTRIAAITGEGPQVRDASHRIRLLQERLRDRGIDLPDARIYDSGDDFTELVARIMGETPRPTAIFCWHDRVAYRVLEACDQLGFSVPHDVSIVGYDGLHWPSSTVHTATSVHVDLERMAVRGMQLLDQIIQGYEGPLLEEVLRVTLTTGTTLGPPPQS